MGPSGPLPKQYKQLVRWVKIKPALSEQTNTMPWWHLYHDETLNRLEHNLNQNNPTLKAAHAKFRAACAAATIARSYYYPTINGIGNVSTQRLSTTSGNSQRLKEYRFANYLAGLTFNYEIDAWGMYRNMAKTKEFLAKSFTWEMKTIQLSLQAELASDYFSLRADDLIQQRLDQRLSAMRLAYNLTKVRFKEGLASDIPMDTLKKDWEDARTEAIHMRLNRAQLENSIAVLTGSMPGLFHIKPKYPLAPMVTVSPNIPSSLLQTRPDIAAAIARVAAANANIGVARAAFFPDFNLFAIFSGQSKDIFNLFSASSVFWTVGPAPSLSILQPTITQVIFDGFKHVGQLKRAKAQYWQTVSQYRAKVLEAFKDVENSLSEIVQLSEENQSQHQAMRASQHKLLQIKKRYEVGIENRLNLALEEATTMDAEINWLKVRTRQQLSSVRLVKALGGGWHQKK
jgi:NodT family efflux transporter outer membrane factor (OMF) lipoprotein